MKAYLNQESIKTATVARMQAHMDADQLIRGTGFKDGRGCAVGCTLDRYNHEAFETELGIPEWVARLNDTLHENTSDDVWPTLQLRFLQSVPTGFADWDKVERGIKAFIQRRNIARVESLDIEDGLKNQVLGAIRGVLALIESDTVTDEEWSAASSAALSAAWSAESAALSAALSAAWSAESAASSAALSAESAARSAASAASSAALSAESAARSAASAASAEFDAIAEELLRLVTV